MGITNESPPYMQYTTFFSLFLLVALLPSYLPINLAALNNQLP